MTPDVATLGATKWFANKACALQQKKLTIRNATSDKEIFPAVTLLQKAYQLQEQELKTARAIWENRTGCKSRADGIDDEITLCHRLESRSSDSSQLPKIALLNKLTMFEQALFSWANHMDSPVNIFNAEPAAWAGIPPLEGSATCHCSSTECSCVAPLVYGGWVRSLPRLHSLRLDCTRRRMSLIAILPDDLQPSDHHIAGLVCWWPELSGEEGSSHAPDSVTRGRLTVWHYTPAPQSDKQHPCIPGYLSEWPMLFRDHPSTGIDPHEAEFSRSSLLLQLAQMLRSGSKGQWWWPMALRHSQLAPCSFQYTTGFHN